MDSTRNTTAALKAESQSEHQVDCRSKIRNPFNGHHLPCDCKSRRPLKGDEPTIAKLKAESRSLYRLADLYDGLENYEAAEDFRIAARRIADIVSEMEIEAMPEVIDESVVMTSDAEDRRVWA